MEKSEVNVPTAEQALESSKKLLMREMNIIAEQITNIQSALEKGISGLDEKALAEVSKEIGNLYAEAKMCELNLVTNSRSPLNK